MEEALGMNKNEAIELGRLAYLEWRQARIGENPKMSPPPLWEFAGQEAHWAWAQKFLPPPTNKPLSPVPVPPQPHRTQTRGRRSA